MNLGQVKDAITRLPLHEQVMLLDDLWQGVNNELLLTEQQQALLDERYAAYQTKEVGLVEAQQVHRMLRHAYL